MHGQTALLWPMITLSVAASALLLWPSEGRAEVRLAGDSQSVDELRKEMHALRSRVHELLEADELGNDGMDKRAMLPYSGGIYGKRSGILAAEPYFLSRPSRAVPFNGGMYG